MSKVRWVANGDVSSSGIGSELALLLPASGQYFTLNQTGSTVWQLLEEPHDTDSIVSAVAERYDVSASDCKDDIEELVSRLNDAGLIEKA